MSKGGRPSIFSEELLEELCKRLSESTRPLAAVCRDEDMPSRMTVWEWCQQRPDVSIRVARAREIGEENLAAEALDIADDSANDYSVDEKGRPFFNREHVQRSRLRFDARMQLLAKINPNRWGNRVNQQVTGADGGPVKQEVGFDTSKLSDAALQELLRAVDDQSEPR